MVNPNTAPSIGASQTATPRIISLGNEIFVPGGKIIDGSLSRDPTNTGDLDSLQAGITLGQITATGLYAPAIIGPLTVAYDKDASFDTQLTVAAATAVEIVRRIGATGTLTITGPPTPSGTVATAPVTYSGVNTTTGLITITALAADYVAGSFLGGTDGSQLPRVLLGGQWPVKVTDDDDNNIDILAPLILVGGLIDASQIINAPSDTSLITWLHQTRLNSIGQFIFDSDL